MVARMAEHSWARSISVTLTFRSMKAWMRPRVGEGEGGGSDCASGIGILSSLSSSSFEGLRSAVETGVTPRNGGKHRR